MFRGLVVIGYTDIVKLGQSVANMLFEGLLIVEYCRFDELVVLGKDDMDAEGLADNEYRDFDNLVKLGEEEVYTEGLLEVE